MKYFFPDWEKFMSQSYMYICKAKKLCIEDNCVWSNELKHKWARKPHQRNVYSLMERAWATSITSAGYSLLGITEVQQSQQWLMDNRS